MVACGQNSGVRVAVKDIQITFAKTPVAPGFDVPKEAHEHMRASDDLGPLSHVVAGHIAAITITWSDDRQFKTPQEVENLVRQLLTTYVGTTSTEIDWPEVLTYPSITATVEHTSGKKGRWLIWYREKTVRSVYQDRRGNWLFSWLYEKGLNSQSKKSETK